MLRGYGAFSGVIASADALLGASLVVIALACDQPPSEGEFLQLPF